MILPWPIKESFMEHVKGDQEEHPYVVGLKYGIEAKLSEFVCKELCVSVEFGVLWVCCKTIVEDKADNIKALVVALPSYLINTKVFPFPIFDLC